MTLEGLLLRHFPAAYEEKRAQVEAELQRRSRWDSVVVGKGRGREWEGKGVGDGGVMTGIGKVVEWEAAHQPLFSPFLS